MLVLHISEYYSNPSTMCYALMDMSESCDSFHPPNNCPKWSSARLLESFPLVR